MDRRQFLGGAGAVAASVFSSGARAQTKLEISRLGLGFGLDPVFAPHIVAMQKGWLKEAGFDEIVTKSFTGGALAGEALIAGEIQLWTPGNLPPISLIHAGVPIVVLGTNCIAAAADSLVARKDANIQQPEDLYRIKIGLLAGSTASAMLHGLAKHYGLDEKKLQVVNMPPPEQFASLNSNNVQALLCWQPWGYKSVSNGNVLVHSGTESGFAKNKGEKVRISATRSLFVASEGFVREKPNATRALVAVLTRAQAYVADPKNRAEILPLVAKETKQELPLVEAIWDQYEFNPSFDEGYVADMGAMTSYLVSAGVIHDAKNPLDFTYTAPAAAAGVAVKVAGRWKA
jgi:ABC-type nitrate/sulfonate/bicarbonate transport system substrate-binding protein